MNGDSINQAISQYVARQEIPGCALVVCKDGETVYKNHWGYADIAVGKPIAEDSIYRMMSMTKCVTTVGVLKLMEQGKLALDDPLSRFLPAFSNMRVSCDARYAFHEGMNKLSLLPKLLFFRMDNIKTEPAAREITLRDLLSHSAGIEQGVLGLIAMMKDKSARESLARQADKYARYALDFQPGTGTGYSPLAGFDLLARVIEIASGEDAESFFRLEIFEPLGMRDSAFELDAEQKKRLVRLYCRKGERLKDVTGTRADVDGVLRRKPGYVAGCGGLYSTLPDYERFVRMLLEDGRHDGKPFLRPETVARLRTEAPEAHLEPEPGHVWGLGVKIRQDPRRGGSPATAGSYGWSGAFGTHFFISPADRLACVWMVNRSDLGGASSYISRRVEELVFSQFAG